MTGVGASAASGMDAGVDWLVGPQQSLPEVVGRRVVDAIRTGVLRPGARIIEAELAQKLGVSRGSLREALKALEANHLVEHRRSRGTFVAQASPPEVLQIVTLRATLEGLAARLVTANGDAASLAGLEAQQAAMRADAKAGRVDTWREHNWQFHEMVCRASGNAALLRAWSSISNQVRLFLHEHPAFEHEADEVLRNHVRMMAALRAGDPDAAERVFRAVILRSGLRRLGLDAPPGLADLVDAS